MEFVTSLFEALKLQNMNILQKAKYGFASDFSIVSLTRAFVRFIVHMLLFAHSVIGIIQVVWGKF